MKATLRDIAAAAGVGTATVERVINGRGGVTPETAEKVFAAARRLAYPRTIAQRHRGLVRIEVILARQQATFFARLSRSFERIAATIDSAVSVHRTFVNEADPQAIADRILNPQARRSGLIIAVPHYQGVGEALNLLLARSVPVLQIVTPVDGVDAPFVGIDNEAAGRMAGLLMSGMQNRCGPVLGLCHSQVYPIHRQRISGFAHGLEKHGRGNLRLFEVGHTHDHPMEAADRLMDAIGRCPDLVGLYNAGGGNSALCDALRRHGSGKIVFIGHELTEHTTVALREGTMHVVLDQSPEAQARRAIDLMLARLGILDAEVGNPPIRFTTITAENI